MAIAVLFTSISGCHKIPNLDFRKEMRNFVQDIGIFARAQNPNFILIPQNGQELLVNDNLSDVNTTYVAAINGVGREDMFYGFDNDNQATSASNRDYMISYCDVARNNGKKVLVIDYCSDHTKMDDSYQQNFLHGYISTAADHRELDNVPAYPAQPFNVNNSNITSLDSAKNFLYLINAQNYTTKQNFITAVSATNYDVLIMDAYFNEVLFTASEISQLKTKANGGSRLVIAYMSIGEAEDYRWYWQSGWKPHKPSFIDKVNPDWAGNYKVRYWEQGWKNIIYGNSSSYTQKLLDAGFDGAYLDIIDAFEYYENY